MPALSDADKERTRYHLGYMLTSFAPSIQLGIPRPVQTLFLVEDAMNLIADAQSVTRIQCILSTLDQLEKQLRAAVPSLAAERIGDITLHPLRSQGKLFTDSIEREYRRWGGRLADVLGVPFYPFSDKYKKRGPGSNIPVS